jgi:hypothetical protein
MDKDDVIEQLAAMIYYGYGNLHGIKGARWEAVEPRHKETVWKAKARKALED